MNGKTQKKNQWRLRPRERVTLLLCGDLITGIMALLLALYYWAMGDSWLNFSWEFLKTRPDFWFYLLPLLWVILLMELYDVHRAGRWKDTIQWILFAGLIYIAIYLLIYFSSPPNSLPRRGVAVFIIGAMLLTLLWRLIYIRIFTARHFLRKVLIIGAGNAGQALLGMVQKLKPAPLEIVGWIDDDPQKAGKEVMRLPVLGNGRQLLQICADEDISEIIVAITGELQGELFQAILDARENGIDVTTMPTAYEELLSRVPIFHLQSDWLVRSFIDQTNTSGLYEFGKRMFDIVGGLIGIVLLAVVYPITALVILLDSGSPVLYKQVRLGKGGQPYNILKFRTMRQDSEKDGKLRFTSTNDNRITRVGNLLRKSHIDEFPQFINVLMGQMSLVGPRSERPGFVQELQQQLPFYRARLLVKPGVTGWAQVNFGYAGDVETSAIKLEYDLYYIKHRNLVLDFMILFKTLGTVIKLKGF
jgi:exopolysaccharide biosynthesis polyprenyl glycosylphosphotransferase